jgi:hypothetical protein
VPANRLVQTESKQTPIVAGRIPPLGLALGLIVVLAGFVFLPMVKANPGLLWSFVGAAAALGISLFFLYRQVLRRKRTLTYEFLPRPVHYVQLVMHASVYAYWGWYWREVYHEVPLIIAQIIFVYVLDMLVCWFRRDKWILGFGPFPIVLSTNLFLWFKSDWFFLQFLMIATGVLCKEFLTWKREGRRVHIFNPSAIALFIFSLGLILTHSTAISWGDEIAVSFGRPPHIYMEIFLLGLVVQGLFSVTLVTLSAAAALFALNLVFTHTTGLYFFIDSNIPAAVFLGLHLLVTDPATSPRKDPGKVVFGAGYGAAVFGLYWLLGHFGAPTFYDKLLCVPLLNLTVQWLDRASTALTANFRIPDWTPRKWNFAYMGVWICLFAGMYTTGFLEGTHPGANPEFWRRACVAGRSAACDSWVQMMDTACHHGSGSACVILGKALYEGQLTSRDLPAAGKALAHGCELGVSAGCGGVFHMVKESQGSFFETACDKGDGESCFLLGSLYYAGSGVPKDPGRAFELFSKSCSDGWSRGCSGLAECYRAGVGTTEDDALALENFDKACRAGVASSCFSASAMYRTRNEGSKALARLRQGCQIGARFAESNEAYFEKSSLGKAASAPAFCPTSAGT